MRIEGDIQVIQASINYYNKLVSTANVRSVEQLRQYYYREFLQNKRSNYEQDANKVIELNRLEKQKSTVPVHGTYVEDIVVDEVIEVDTVIEVGGVSDANAKSYEVHGVDLGIISSSDEDIKEDTVIFGTFIENISIEEDVPQPSEEPLESHGVFIDDIEVASEDSNEYSEVDSTYIDDSFQNLDEEPLEESYDNYQDAEVLEEPIKEFEGTLLEEQQDLNNFEEQVTNEEDHDCFGEEEYLQESNEELEGISNGNTQKLVEESDWLSEDEPFSEPKDVGYQSSGNIVSFAPKGEDSIPLEVSKKDDPDEPVVLPPTVREYIKKHRGVTLQDVKKLYSDKQINKEIKSGKIFLRKGQLSI